MGNELGRPEKNKGKTTKRFGRKEKQKKEKNQKEQKKETDKEKEEKKVTKTEEEGIDTFEKAREDILTEERPLLNLAGITNFDVPTIRELKSIFTEISQSEVKDGIIDLEELTNALGLSPTSVLAKTLFRLFDVTQTKQINFRVWVTTLSALSPKASLEDKIQFSFKLYDINGDGKIDKDELAALLKAALQENTMGVFTMEQVEDLVENTLALVDQDKNGTVEYQEYHDMVIQSPKTVLESFTVDISSLCAAYRQVQGERASKSGFRAGEIERRKGHLQSSEKEREDGLKIKSPRGTAPTDAEFDLNARPVAERDLSLIFADSPGKDLLHS